MLRSAISVFTRVFDALWRCAADRGSIMDPYPWIPALRSSVKNAAPRPGHETHCFTTSQDEVERLAGRSLPRLLDGPGHAHGNLERLFALRHRRWRRGHPYRH